MRDSEPDETRAEVARRRLAQLTAAFEADLPQGGRPGPGPDEREPAMSQRANLGARPRPRLTSTHLRLMATVGVAAAVVLVWTVLSGRPQTDDTAGSVPVATSDASPIGDRDAPAELVVDVVGKVRQPGIVTVPRGSRVFEAIEAAGGLKGKVDTSGVNLARKLEDGEQVVVGPAADPPSGAVASGGGATGATAKINLNQATTEQLDTLPGVGPVTAASILAWRDENGRFSSVEDLLDVKGIGDATFAELRDLVTV